MANLVGLALIKFSIGAWNRLQRLPDVRFRNLKYAGLRNVSLYATDLSGVDLSFANLSFASLKWADLSGANLSDAHLEFANLEGANLSRANLDQATLGETSLSNVDLSSTKGLDTCKHIGPSSVDNHTLARSKGVPIEFWRGCGFSDWEIEAAKLSQPGLTQDDVISISYDVVRLRSDQPLQLFSPFISYSSKDDAFARRLYDGLQQSGVRCWYAPEDMKIGDRIRNRIDEVIHLHDKLLLILSEHSVASHWVEQEVETALAKERETGETVLFPIKVDHAVDSMKTGWPALVRNTRHIGDFTNWVEDSSFEAAFNRILRDLRAGP